MKDVKPIGYYKLTNNANPLYYTDLSGYRDDITVLTNPHKGWYIHFVDNGMHRSFYRDGIKNPEDIKDLPGTKFLYLRLDWSDLEPEQGKFKFNIIDEIFDQYAMFGFKFIFRLCTYEANKTADYSATPEWVYELGAKAIKTEADLEPVYDDPIFLEHLDKFVAAFAQRYDGHPLVESVDIGTFGTWGEGHTSFGSWTNYPAEAYQPHVDMHIRHFVKTRLTMNYGLLIAIYNTDREGAVRLSEYAYAMGMGMRDDSIGVPYYTQRYGYDTLITHDLFDRYYKTAPVDIEFGHLWQIDEKENIKDGLPLLEAVKRAHATFAGFHGYVDRWLEQYGYLHDYIANRLGYWYFVEGFELPPALAHTKCMMRITMVNRGFAPTYYGYTAQIVLRNDDKTYTVYDGAAENKNWLPDTPYIQSYPLDLSAVPQGEYEVCLGIFEGDTPIRLALNQKLFDGKLYTLGSVKLN